MASSREAGRLGEEIVLLILCWRKTVALHPAEDVHCAVLRTTGVCMAMLI